MMQSISILTLGLLGCIAPSQAQLVNPVTRFEDITIRFPNTTTWPTLHTDFAPGSMPDCGETSYVGRGRLVGRHALVTGGDSGLGRAIVIAYMREGAKVAINYLPEEEADASALADLLLEEFPDRPLIRIPGNLRNVTFCDHLADRAVEELGALDILVNNAGVGGVHAGPNWRNITTTSRDDLLAIFETNVFAPFYLTQAALPHMRPGSSLIYMASGQGVRPTPFALPYAASKAALRHMMSTIAMQLGPFGIRANAVAPGAIYTGFLHDNGASGENMTSPAGTMPFGRIGQPVEVSPLFVALATDELSYTSGSVFGAHGAEAGVW